MDRRIKIEPGDVGPRAGVMQYGPAAQWGWPLGHAVSAGAPYGGGGAGCVGDGPPERPYATMPADAVRPSAEGPGTSPARIQGARLPRFDGTVKWRSFLTQFELAAAAAKWGEEEKALQLSLCLHGDALEVLGQRGTTDRCDYTSLVKMLTRRFDDSAGLHVLRTEFGLRRRRPAEPLTALATDVERLAHRIYADSPAEFAARLALDKFLEALSPDDLREYTVLQHPATLDEALSIAREKEALRASIGTHSSSGRAASALDSGARDTSSRENVGRDANAASPKTRHAGAAERSVTSGTVPSALEKRMERVERLLLEIRGRSPSSSPGRSASGERRRADPRTCWVCGVSGHVAKDCYRRAGNAWGP